MIRCVGARAKLNPNGFSEERNYRRWSFITPDCYRFQRGIPRKVQDVSYINEGKVINLVELRLPSMIEKKPALALLLPEPALLVEFIQKGKVDVQATDEKGNTTLHYLARRSARLGYPLKIPAGLECLKEVTNGDGQTPDALYRTTPARK